MKILRRYISFLLLIALSGTSCIKEVKVPLRFVPGRLVVEGIISTDPGPHSIRLSMSGDIGSGLQVPEENLVKDAQVLIRDDQGKVINLTHTGSGIYQTDSSVLGEVGRTYTADITLTDGKKYVSKPEKIAPIVPIDSFQIRFLPDFSPTYPSYLRTYIYTSDPPDQENYYKWEFYSYTRRRTLGVGCGFGCVMLEYCLQRISDNELQILADGPINGNDIVNQGIGNSYIFSYGSHFFDIAQASITREAYQYLQLYKEQSSRTGSVLDPLPASIRGNIVSADNPEEFALGFFSARSIIHKKVIVIPHGITQYLLDISADAFFLKKSIPCYDAYPNTLYYDPPPADQVPPPPAWNNADTVRVYWNYP